MFSTLTLIILVIIVIGIIFLWLLIRASRKEERKRNIKGISRPVERWDKEKGKDPVLEYEVHKGHWGNKKRDATQYIEGLTRWKK